MLGFKPRWPQGHINGDGTSYSVPAEFGAKRRVLTQVYFPRLRSVAISSLQ
jgi:hypothetical protein